METLDATDRSREFLGWLFVAFYVMAIYSLPGTGLSGALAPLLIVASGGLAFTLIRGLRAPWMGATAFLAIAAVEDLSIGLLSGGRAAPSEVVLLVANTTIFAGMLLLCSAASREAMRTVLADHGLMVPVVLYSGVVVVASIASPAPLSARAPALRNLGAFLVLFYLGLLLPAMSGARLRRVITGFWWIVIVVLAFGVFERFVVGDEFWVRVFNLDRLAEAKNLVSTRWSLTPLPADFYTPVGDVYIRRMASLFATPITLGYFLAFALFLSVFEWYTRRAVVRRWWLLVTLLIGASLSVTLVKGAYQIAAVGMFGLAITGYAMNRGWRFSRVLIIWTVSTLPLVAAGVILFPRSTAFLHVYGLVQTFLGLSGRALIVGNGVGTGGTVSRLLGAEIDISEATGAESGIGTLLYQLGLFGTVLYLTIVLGIAGRLYRVASDSGLRRESRVLAWAVLGALLGLVSNVFLQENALAPVPISTFFIFAGLALNPVLLRHATVTLNRGSHELPGPAGSD